MVGPIYQDQRHAAVCRRKKPKKLPKKICTAIDIKQMCTVVCCYVLLCVSVQQIMSSRSHSPVLRCYEWLDPFIKTKGILQRCALCCGAAKLHKRGRSVQRILGGRSLFPLASDSIFKSVTHDGVILKSLQTPTVYCRHAYSLL